MSLRARNLQQLSEGELISARILRGQDVPEAQLSHEDISIGPGPGYRGFRADEKNIIRETGQG